MLENLLPLAGGQDAPHPRGVREPASERVVAPRLILQLRLRRRPGAALPGPVFRQRVDNGAAARGERRAGRVPGQGPGRAEPERRLRGRAARGVPRSCDENSARTASAAAAGPRARRRFFRRLRRLAARLRRRRERPRALDARHPRPGRGAARRGGVRDDAQSAVNSSQPPVPGAARAAARARRRRGSWRRSWSLIPSPAKIAAPPPDVVTSAASAGMPPACTHASSRPRAPAESPRAPRRERAPELGATTADASPGGRAQRSSDHRSAPSRA